jgi:hypothetical protein
MTMTDESQKTRTLGPPFLRIPVARLIVLSILSCGIYQAYWIYEHWAHIKRRDRLKISPFWRGAFCVFYCHSLLKRIHADAELRAAQQPSFSPGRLATGWIVAILAANLVDLGPGAIATSVSLLVPSYLFVVPVQNYVNSATHKLDPAEPYRGWSFGHVFCLVLGLAIWGFTIWGPQIVSFSIEP